MNDKKTIKELADELGVSKQRIQQIIAKLPTSKAPSKVGNKYLLNSEDVYNIRNNMGIKIDKKSANNLSNRVVDYDIYLEVVNASKEKDIQINNLISSQKQTQNLLDQQQQLQLKTQQMLEEKTSLLELKSDELNQLHEKRWWQFWK